MKVTVAVVAYNEEAVIGQLFKDILKQDYPHRDTEILFVDSASTDATETQMREFQEKYENEFFNILVCHNPKRIQAAGWNVAISAFTTEALIRIDAHASIPSNFVRCQVEKLQEGEMVSGGSRPNIAVKDTAWSRVLLEAESSMFGSSIASYRKGNDQVKYVKSLFHAIYRREVFERVGGFDEQLGRTEDNEFHYRVRQAGFRLCFDPNIISFQHIRPTLRKMCRQKYGNGYWIGLTLGVCPGCLSLFHFVPFAFLGAVVFTALLALVGYFWPAVLLWGLYWLTAICMSVLAVREDRKCAAQLFLPILFLALHISYGAGTCMGLLSMPAFIRKYQTKDALNGGKYE